MPNSRKSFYRTVLETVQRELRWLSPGVGLKRWLLLIMLGNTFIGVGIAMLLLDFYRNAPDTWWLPAVSFLALRFLTRPLRVLIFGGIGLGLLLFGLWGFNKTLLSPFLQPGKRVLDSLSEFRKRERGPRIVAIGGGTGLYSLLRGIKTFTHNITAIVTVADDGGSSGELRRTLGVLPPGDIRNCLAALANDETLMTHLFQYRFSGSNGLTGHSMGNLFITAMTEITGSFEQAIAESGKVLAVRGRVYPSTLHDVRLAADIQLPDRGREVHILGESRIPEVNGKIRRVWLEPDNPKAYPPAIQAILNADLILIGPGSLFTSILPNLLVSDIAEAIRVSRGLKFFICNVATQRGETDSFTCEDHVKTIEQYIGEGIFDVILCNHNTRQVLPDGVQWVLAGDEFRQIYPVYCADLVDAQNPTRHDPHKLAMTIMEIFEERTGPLNIRENLNNVES